MNQNKLDELEVQVEELELSEDEYYMVKASNRKNQND